ncbi:MAG: hypothetical protein J6386_01360 [Candidatus Synoicihabitans palmerolidicus]|nr:hypothetical protein [Candidatus Synoicihabitans palmerolidicus]
MIFGNIGLGDAGSLDYKLFYGDIPMKVDSGANDYFSQDAPFPNLEIGMKSALGGTLYWNTPWAGLRAGYSYSEFRDFTFIREVAPGAIYYRRAGSYERHLTSVEYLFGDWTIAAEAYASERRPPCQITKVTITAPRW